MLHSFLNFRQLKSENAVEILSALPSSNDHLSKTPKFYPPGWQLKYRDFQRVDWENLDKSDANSVYES